MTFWENMFVGSVVAGLATDSARNNAANKVNAENNSTPTCTENVERTGISLGNVVGTVIELAIMAVMFVAMLHFASHVL